MHDVRAGATSVAGRRGLDPHRGRAPTTVGGPGDRPRRDPQHACPGFELLRPGTGAPRYGRVCPSRRPWTSRGHAAFVCRHVRAPAMHRWGRNARERRNAALGAVSAIPWRISLRPGLCGALALLLAVAGTPLGAPVTRAASQDLAANCGVTLRMLPSTSSTAGTLAPVGSVITVAETAPR